MSYILGLVIGTVVGIILHEIGHAIAGKLNGWPIKEFRLGKAPFVWQGNYWGIRFELGLQPFSGQVSCLPDMHASKAKFIFFHSSGLIVNTIVFLLAYSSFLKSEYESGFFFLGVIVSQAVIIFFNLFPFASEKASPLHDGRNIWKYIISKQTPIETWKDSLNLIFAPYAEITDSYFKPSELMLEFLKIGLEKNSLPDSQILDRKLVVLEKLQKSFTRSKIEELYMLDAVITNILLHDFERKKSQLHELGERALSIGAYSNAILQTYRSVLVESGKFGQALGYFNPEEDKSKSDFVASLNLVYRARAENGAGDRQVAIQLGQDAKNLIAKIPQASEFQCLLNRMEAEFQSKKDP